MKKYVWILILLIWILGACAPKPKPTEQSLFPNDDSYPNPSYPNGDNSSPQAPMDLTPAESAAVAALSGTLNLPPGQITVVSSEAVTWPDGCLGVQRMGVMCTQALVEGFRIVLAVDGKEYEYHTNQNGSAVVPASGLQAFASVEGAVIAQLAANLGLKESNISVVSKSDVEFADTCLDVALSNVTCAQAATPGMIIVLEADGVQYEYHVSADGTHVQPATLALIWTREGGIAGFCDSLTVFLSGEVYGNQCKSQPNETTGAFATLLSNTEREQFNTWFKELGQVNLDMSDPEGVSDRMEVKLAFYGSGKGTLSKADEQGLLLWVQTLYQKLYS